MKILHLMNIHPRFTNDVVDLYNEYFNNGEHEICYLTKGDASNIRTDITIKQHELYIKEYKGFQINKVKKLIDMFNRYDYIIMHGFILDELPFISFCLLCLFMGNNLYKKLVWIEWGVDLYNFKQEGNGLKPFIKYNLIKAIKNYVKMVVGIFPPDCEVYKEKYPNSNAIVMYAPYFGLNGRKNYHEYNLSSRLEKSLNENDCVYIQIGHNAQEQLNHIETLNILEKYKNENIKIFLPLNYGNTKEYISKVENHAKKLFDEKVLILKEYLPLDEYNKLLDRIDIAIFNTKRQTGLANIYKMINNNVKLYMPKGSVMYEHFISIDIPINSIQNIKDMTFVEFSKNTDFSKYNGPRKLIESLLDNDKRIVYWTNIYNRLRELNEYRK